MDLKPTLDIMNLRCPKDVQLRRRMRMETIIQHPYTDADRKQIAAVLRTLRSRQTRRLGGRDEDPSPYDPQYVFYCLTGTRELYS
jgi:hypothetical protein